MAKKTNKRSQGGGRTANTEPRYQVFSGFGGCNFELSPNEFDLLPEVYDVEQTDLQMNYVVIQNNAKITSNKTIETRPETEILFSKDRMNKLGSNFTGPSIVVGQEFFAATEDGSVWCGLIGEKEMLKVDVTSHDDSEHHWQSFAYIDGKVVGATKENKLYIGIKSDSGWSFSDRPKIQDPADSITVTAKGDLKVSDTYSEACPYRIGVSFALVNIFGPTAASPEHVFYASLPVTEWHSGQYATIGGENPVDELVDAVELYYTVDNSSDFLFLDRVDISSNASKWSYNWTGYLNATDMWAVGNLIRPTQNYTQGCPASRMTVVDGRLYFWGDQENPYRLYIGGNSGNLFSVSNGTGGGFVDIEPDTGVEVRFVDKYKTQSGNSIVTILCDSPNSTKEKRFNLVENTISLSNEQSMKSWQAEEVSGAVGCKSFTGALVCEDGLYAVSRYGLSLTTLTMEYNSQIRTNYVSAPVKPIFTNVIGEKLSNSVLLDADGVIYLCLGDGVGGLDDLLFCYDVNLKAWWSYDFSGFDEPILNIIHVDWEGYREGLGLITPSRVYLLPTTIKADEGQPPFDVLIETGELSAQLPAQQWTHISQIELRFASFIGELTVELRGVDQFGRKIATKKTISHDMEQRNLKEYMRVDLKLESYKIILKGRARFRLSHLIIKLYTMSKRQGIVWGFDSEQSFRSSGDIHPTFNDYNDVKNAIIP